MSEALIDIAALRAERLNGTNPAWPPLIDITSGQHPVPPFPVDLLPAPFSTFVADVADRLQVPADFVAIPLLVASATMLGRELWLAPKLHDDWRERACLWGTIISPPSSMKTPAAEEALRAIRKMQHEAWERYKIEHEIWERSQDQEGGQGPEPQFDALMANETTVEALSRLMVHNPRGMMIHRDELSGWFNSLNKYRVRGGDDRQFFLQCWAGGAHRVDRVGKPPIYVDDLYLSLFGTLQPEIARSAFRGGDADGMTARFGLLVWPDLPERVDVVDRRPNFEARDAVEQRLREMREISREEPLRFDGWAYSLFNEWLLRNVNRPELRDGAFGQHLSKYRGLFARLALVLHFMRHGSQAPKEVDLGTAEAVRSLIDEYLEPHARKIYGAMAVHPAHAGAVKIANWLRQEHVPKFTARNVRRHGWAEFAKDHDEDAIQASMALLDAYGWIKLEEKRTGAHGGRPTKLATVNPVIVAASG